MLGHEEKQNNNLNVDRYGADEIIISARPFDWFEFLEPLDLWSAVSVTDICEVDITDGNVSAMYFGTLTNGDHLACANNCLPRAIN